MTTTEPASITILSPDCSVETHMSALDRNQVRISQMMNYVYFTKEEAEAAAKWLTDWVNSGK